MEKFKETVNKHQTTKIISFKWRCGQRQRRLVKEHTVMTSKFRLVQFAPNRQGRTIITSLPLALGSFINPQVLA